MAKQIVVLALIFLAAVGMPTIIASRPAPYNAPTTNDLAEIFIEEEYDSVIAPISGPTANDAAPVGGPISGGVLPPAFAPSIAPTTDDVIEGFNYEAVIGGINGGDDDAAPAEGPIPDGVIPDDPVPASFPVIDFSALPAPDDY